MNIGPSIKFEPPSPLYECKHPDCWECTYPAEDLFWAEGTDEYSEGFYCDSCFDNWDPFLDLDRGISLKKWLTQKYTEHCWKCKDCESIVSWSNEEEKFKCEKCGEAKAK